MRARSPWPRMFDDPWEQEGPFHYVEVNGRWIPGYGKVRVWADYAEVGVSVLREVVTTRWNCRVRIWPEDPRDITVLWDGTALTSLAYVPLRLDIPRGSTRGGRVIFRTEGALVDVDLDRSYVEFMGVGEHVTEDPRPSALDRF